MMHASVTSMPLCWVWINCFDRHITETDGMKNDKEKAIGD